MMVKIAHELQASVWHWAEVAIWHYHCGDLDACEQCNRKSLDVVQRLLSLDLGSLAVAWACYNATMLSIKLRLYQDAVDYCERAFAAMAKGFCDDCDIDDPLDMKCFNCDIFDDAGLCDLVGLRDRAEQYLEDQELK